MGAGGIGHLRSTKWKSTAISATSGSSQERKSPPISVRYVAASNPKVIRGFDSLRPLHQLPRRSPGQSVQPAPQFYVWNATKLALDQGT